jgi:hypothetical protein
VGRLGLKVSDIFVKQKYIFIKNVGLSLIFKNNEINPVKLRLINSLLKSYY